MKNKSIAKQRVTGKVANTVPSLWRATILDANDGSGDGTIELPDALLSQLDWKLGDVVILSLTDAGSIMIRRKE